VRVDDVTYDEAVALIERFILEGGPHLVTTPNPEIVMAARAEPSLRALLDRTTLNIPDGIGLLVAARLLGGRLREHVRGTDLVERLAARGAALGHRWYLLGAAPGVAHEAAGRLAARHPDLRIVGAAPGSPRSEDDARVRGEIAQAGPVDLILVAYGAPAQERWLDRNLGPLGIPVGIGVGGVFNYLSGRAPRAPLWMRRLELEWLHRLLTQPRRLRRQLALPDFLAFALVIATRRALAGRRPAAR
jgi:N-acetylglucosaminyldiphosphoundecaprenol N-acetyl-beta-D-mannosaminyltransferase